MRIAWLIIFTMAAKAFAQVSDKYISTKQPGGKRKIKFKEVNGELTGNDNGYRCKLIPVGEGKFTKADDGASFVFDTKNTKAITLLLFGTFNLKKTK